jgi:hypothetical protein
MLDGDEFRTGVIESTLTMIQLSVFLFYSLLIYLTLYRAKLKLDPFMKATLFFIGLSVAFANTNIFLLFCDDDSIFYMAGDYLPGYPQ